MSVRLKAALVDGQNEAAQPKTCSELLYMLQTFLRLCGHMTIQHAHAIYWK